jgi:hypothetical protein
MRALRVNYLRAFGRLQADSNLDYLAFIEYDSAIFSPIALAVEKQGVYYRFFSHISPII